MASPLLPSQLNGFSSAQAEVPRFRSRRETLTHLERLENEYASCIETAEAEAAQRKAELETSQLCKLRARAAQLKPVEWKGKRYHRAELAGDEAGAKRAEQQNRERWARKVINIIVEAQLPF